MIFTTTHAIAGRDITGYRGIVFGDAIVGVNVMRDLFASIRDIVGGRSAAYEKELAGARQAALENLLAEATALGADAVVGVDIDYQTVGQGGGMLMVTATGTAVTLSPVA